MSLAGPFKSQGTFVWFLTFLNLSVNGWTVISLACMCVTIISRAHQRPVLPMYTVEETHLWNMSGSALLSSSIWTVSFKWRNDNKLLKSWAFTLKLLLSTRYPMDMSLHNHTKNPHFYLVACIFLGCTYSTVFRNLQFYLNYDCHVNFRSWIVSYNIP